jgi:hypothetical protein
MYIGFSRSFVKLIQQMLNERFARMYNVRATRTNRMHYLLSVLF